MMGLVREGKGKVSGSGFIVTWDISSEDQTTANRVKYFVFGRSTTADGRTCEYRGFVWREGVRYVAQSALFVLPHRIEELRQFLAKNGVDHEVDPVTYH